MELFVLACLEEKGLVTLLANQSKTYLRLDYILCIIKYY
jgi:hypothetical protein